MVCFPAPSPPVTDTTAPSPSKPADGTYLARALREPSLSLAALRTAIDGAANRAAASHGRISCSELAHAARRIRGKDSSTVRNSQCPMAWNRVSGWKRGGCGSVLMHRGQEVRAGITPWFTEQLAEPPLFPRPSVHD